ncbi:MAG: hypothetical protein IJT23_06840 [Clostridia bacterium]|nr:hypothetical protein [Clostridia bacterium]
MKKISLFLAVFVTILALCSCGGKTETKEPVPTIDPSTLLTIDDVALATGYQPVLDGGAITTDGNYSKALYLSDPIGQDPVSIEITQYTDDITPEVVFYAYDTARALRSSAEEIPELGETAFVAYPSINIYDRGCYIKITAGSGADENQKNQLLTLARIAVSKFEEQMPAPVIDESTSVEQK